MAFYPLAVDERFQELRLESDPSTLADFRSLLDRCSRAPSRYGTYQIGRLVLDVGRVSVNAYLYQRSIRRLPCRIRPLAYGRVLPRLVGLLRESRPVTDCHTAIEEYLRGLISAQESQGTEPLDMVSVQSRDSGQPPSSAYDTELGLSLPMVGIVESTS